MGYDAWRAPLLAPCKLKPMIPGIEPQPARIISSMVHLMPVLHDSHASSQSCILVQHGAVVSRRAALEGLLGLFCMKASSQGQGDGDTANTVK